MNITPLDSMENVSKNVDLLQHIFKMLTLKDQLNTTAACDEFKFVIEKFIWSSKFTDIKIQRCLRNYLRLCDKTNTGHDLTEAECKIFFQIIASYIQKLHIVDDNENTLFSNCYNFQNLLQLEFRDMSITKQNMEYVFRNCPKLETISFNNWTNFTSNLFDSIIEILSKMKFLKHFNIFANGLSSFSLMTKVLNALNLNSLILESRHFFAVQHTECLKISPSVEKLSIGRFQDPDTWRGFKRIYLKSFPSLTTLSLSGKGVILTDNDMSDLALNCKNLQNLTLKECAVKVKKFPSGFNLKKLSLQRCKHMTWTNLANILSEFDLEEFISFNTQYEGIFDAKFITAKNSLKVFEITSRQSQEVLKIFNSFVGTLDNLKILLLHFNDFLPENNIKNLPKLCPNLEELYLYNAIVLDANDLVKIKSLNTFRFNLLPSLSWPFLAKVLQHLTYVSISMSAHMADLVYNNNLDLCILEPDSNGVTLESLKSISNLQFIKIPFFIFRKYQLIFLDLLERQKKLKLLLFGFNSRKEMASPEFLKQLLNHEKFPTHLRRIKICNKYYDCKSLRQNYDKTIEEFSNLYYCTICI